MTRQIRPIETRYAGCRFRSRLEARWAVFFDARGWPWEYEPQGFQLPSGNYLPDFRVTVVGREPVKVFFEVKPAGAPHDHRWLELAQATRTAVVVARGMHRSGDRCTPAEHSAESYACTGQGSGCVVARDLRLWMNAPKAAWDAASTARFEFGEEPRKSRKRGRK